VLEDFLMDFPGCLLVVSHDRYFMDKIVDHLFVFRGNGKVEDFPGSYSDFRAAEEEKSAERKKQPGSTQQKSDKSVWRDQESGGKLSYSEQKEYQTLEAEIEKLENEKEVLQSRFADKTLSGEAIDALSIDLNKVLDKLAEKTERWFTLSERIGS
jgi:ATP-binding cassette subfamily F protein uup